MKPQTAALWAHRSTNSIRSDQSKACGPNYEHVMSRSIGDTASYLQYRGMIGVNYGTSMVYESQSLGQKKSYAMYYNYDVKN